MANAVPTDALDSLTHKLIDHSHKTMYGTTVENVQAWELRSVLNELRAAREAADEEDGSMEGMSWSQAMNHVAEKMKEARNNP